MKIFDVRGKDIYITGEFAFFMQQTHGIPPEILEDIANDWFNDLRIKVQEYLKGGNGK